MQVPQYMLYEFRNDRLIVGQKIPFVIQLTITAWIVRPYDNMPFGSKMNDLPADMAKLRTSAPFRLDTCTDTSCGRVRYIRTRSIDIDIDWSSRVLAVGFP